MDYSKPDRAEALASEYVAGTMRGSARRRFEALLPSHPALQRAVREWQARLMPMTAAVAEQAPPERVWLGIQQRLWPQAQPLPWWQKLGVWRTLSGAALAGLLASAVLLTQAPAPAAPVIVVLQGTGADNRVAGSFVASFTPDGRAVVTRPLQPVSLTDQRVLELWSVPAQGQGAPVSLGLISAAGPTTLDPRRLPAGLLLQRTDLLAVSVEPPGGSPTGTPTGPVVFAGKLRS